MIRLFAAIGIPEQIRQRLMLLQGGIPGARWSAPENLHITLRFIGEVDDVTADVFDGLLILRLHGDEAFGHGHAKLKGELDAVACLGEVDLADLLLPVRLAEFVEHGEHLARHRHDHITDHLARECQWIELLHAFRALRSSGEVEGSDEQSGEDGRKNEVIHG